MPAQSVPMPRSFGPRAALAYEGLDRPTWAHSELRSTFTEEFVKNRKRYPANFGTWLSDAFVLRNAAQYGLISPKTKRVRRMLNHAKEFAQRVKGALTK